MLAGALSPARGGNPEEEIGEEEVMMSVAKKNDLRVVVALPIVAAIVTVVFRLNFLISPFLFFGLPALYLGVRNPGIVRKSLIFAFFFGTAFWLVLDPPAAHTGAWVIAATVFPFTVLGATIENYFFGILWGIAATIFYEHFFDKGHRGDKISPHIRYFVYGFTPVIAVVVSAFYFAPHLLAIPYFFAWAGTLFAAIPLSVSIYFYPALLRKFTATGLYFAFLLAVFEIVALYGGQWSFPGTEFIGAVSLFGQPLPFEEIFFWVLIGTPGLLAYYEFFADDEK